MTSDEHARWKNGALQKHHLFRSGLIWIWKGNQNSSCNVNTYHHFIQPIFVLKFTLLFDSSVHAHEADVVLGYTFVETPQRKLLLFSSSLSSFWTWEGEGSAVPQLWGFKRASCSLAVARYRLVTEPDQTRLDPIATSAAISTFQQETSVWL